MDDVLRLIRQKAKVDIVFANTCQVWSLRDRARAEVTMSTLKLTMKRERFEYSHEQLASVLTFLADCGVGHLELDSKNRVVALRHIQVTLQSIGLAAIADAKEIPEVKPFQSDTLPKFVDMPKVIHRQEVAHIPSPAVHGSGQIALEFNGTVLKVSLNKDVDIGQVISSMLKFGVLS